MQEINLKDTKPDLRKVLLIGHEGVGKTRFIATMPRPVYVFSFDKGYLTLAGEDGITVGLCMDEDRYKPHAYADFKLKFDQVKKDKGKYKTIAIDSITALSKFMLDHYQRVNNNIDKPAGYAGYGYVKMQLQDVVTQLVTLADYVVCTALIEPEKDDLTGELFFKPSCEGSFRNEMGQWFDAVLFLQVDKNPTTGAKVYKMLTVGDRRQKAKLRIPSSAASKIQAVEEPDFGKLMQKIGG